MDQYTYRRRVKAFDDEMTQEAQGGVTGTYGQAAVLGRTLRPAFGRQLIAEQDTRRDCLAEQIVLALARELATLGDDPRATLSSLAEAALAAAKVIYPDLEAEGE